MDRFRDRFTLAGAKDDSRDAEVMASALRTDPRCFRLLALADPVVIELREWSRIAENPRAERNRLTNRMREQLWRYFPVMLQLEDDLGAEWLLDRWQAVSTPDKAASVRETTRQIGASIFVVLVVFGPLVTGLPTRSSTLGESESCQQRK